MLAGLNGIAVPSIEIPVSTLSGPLLIGLTIAAPSAIRGGTVVIGIGTFFCCPPMRNQGRSQSGPLDGLRRAFVTEFVTDLREGTYRWY